MKAEEEEVARVEAVMNDDDRRFLDELAEGIVRRRMTAPAVFFLESVKPLGFLGSQVMHFFHPIVSAVWSSPTRYERLAKLLEERGAIEVLLRRLEARA